MQIFVSSKCPGCADITNETLYYFICANYKAYAFAAYQTHLNAQ
ncbi:MAG: hypothetical protein ACJA0N_001936 [Pseudohongiellaceae bacterium]|jgi:hypothetical protein